MCFGTWLERKKAVSLYLVGTSFLRCIFGGFVNWFFKKTAIFVRNSTNNKNGIMAASRKPYTTEQQRLASYAKAMGHPIRLYVLDLLSKQACCYSGDLSEELPIAKSTLSQHLKALRDAGLIQGEIEAPKVRYCLNKTNWEEAKQLFNSFLKQGTRVNNPSCDC